MRPEQTTSWTGVQISFSWVVQLVSYTVKNQKDKQDSRKSAKKAGFYLPMTENKG
jgi:hypothetical protein